MRQASILPTRTTKANLQIDLATEPERYLRRTQDSWPRRKYIGRSSRSAPGHANLYLSADGGVTDK